MKVNDPRPVDPGIVAEVSGMLASGLDHNQVLVRMRGLGLNKIECIKLLRDCSGLNLGQAKDAVDLSPAWADRYESDQALHDTAEQALEHLPTEDKLTAA